MKSTRFALSALASVAALGAAAAPAGADPTPIYASTTPVYEPAQPSASASLASIVAFASTSGSSHFDGVSFIPVDALACGPTNYRTVTFYDIDTAGDVYGSALYSTATTCTGGTGDWTAGRAAVTAPLSYDMPAGHTLMVLWQSSGAGVALPAGAWRVE